MYPRYLLTMLIMALFITQILTQKPQARDFTYAELEVNKDSTQTQPIHLKPQRSILDRYEFPQTWEISQFLAQSIEKEITIPQIPNFKQQIASLKQTASQFLKLSNKAELLVKNIKLSEDQFAVIEEHEKKLLALNDEINNKGVELENIVQELMIQQENPLFKQAALNFEKKALTSKITLLNSLLTEANSNQKAIQRKNSQNKLNDYFLQLENIFKAQNGLIDAIDTLLKNHNELTILKARVTSLTSQLKAHDLTLAEKQECNQEFLKIKEKQKHDREVLKLIETLKLKKQQLSEPNKYCEGVEKKLIDRIKKLLIGYDYVYECAQDLEHVRESRDLIKKELQEAQKKLDELQLSRGVEEFRKTFENNRDVIAMKVLQLKQLKLDDFYRHPNSISVTIQESERRIGEIQSILQKQPQISSFDLSTIQEQIRVKVNEIQLLKARYCEQDELYNRDVEIVEGRIGKLEQQQEYNSWIRKMEVEKLEELEEIKSRMKQLQAEIMSQLM